MAYLVLLAAALALLAFTRWRVPEMMPNMLASTVGMGSSLGLTDFIVAGILRLYTFHPGLMADPSKENALGALFADFLFVPITFGCLMVLFPRYRLVAAAGLVVLQTLIEVVFAGHGLFVHHYWNVWWSVVLFALRFGVAVWWLQRLERVGYTPGFRLLLNGVSVTYGWWLWAVVSSGILRIWWMRLRLLAEPQPDRILSNFLIYGVPFGFAGGLFLMRRWGDRPWHWWGFAAGAAVHMYLLRAAGIFGHRPGWSPVYEATVATVVLWGCSQFDRLLGEHFQSARPRARA